MARGTISGLITGVAVSAVGLGVAALVVEPVRLGDAPVVTYGDDETAQVEARETPVEPVAEEAAEQMSDAAPDAPEAVEVEPEAVMEPDPEPEPETRLVQVPEPDVTEEMPQAEAEEADLAPKFVKPETRVEEPVEEAESEEEPVELAEAQVQEPQSPQDQPAEAVVADPARETPTSEPTEDVVAEPEAMPDPDVTETLEEPEPASEGEASDTIVVDVEDETPPTIDAPMPSAPAAQIVDTPDAEAEPPVVTGRLPSIGSEAPSPEVEETAPEAETVEAELPERAIERNATDYTAAEGLPEVSLLLIDTPEGRGEVGDLSVLPFPLSVAVDLSALDAEEAVAFYRGAGAEVIAIVPLPEGATPTDVEVTFQAYEPLLSDAVAVMFAPETGFQTLGASAVQAAEALMGPGLGLVTFPEGLNTGHKSAVKEGVPAGLVFRDLDGDGQDGATMRRFLDNVAFRARADEGVIAVARVKPESVQAILEWSLGSRAQSVSLAPVSAVLDN